MKLWWKIVEYDGKNVRTLFHAVAGSRVLQLGLWLPAVKKMVRDGSGKNWYVSGFHVMASRDACLEYLKRFKNMETKALALVEVDQVRPKESSGGKVFLADAMRVLSVEVLI
jgi:hypothetical protein